jgi:nucleoside-diphosphate kinase
MERTLSIIKPDAVRKSLTGKINAKIEGTGLKIVAQKMMKMTIEQAEAFYAIHKTRPFFNDLVRFMVSGPVIVQVLEGENAIEQNRNIMGATNPNDAAPGTIRKEYASDIEANCIHGSDSITNAKQEIAFFFHNTEIFKV